MAYTTINKGSSYFNPVLYTGTGATISVTGVGFKPDWVWQKGRSTAYENNWYDIVRGTATLVSESSGAENPNGASDFSTYNADGFTLNQSANYELSNNGTTYVAWNWLASNTTVSNTSGSITSTVSVNTTSGFSIVGWTGNGTNGATVGHGLGVTPKMIIIKNRSTVTAWLVQHIGLSGAPTANSSTLTLSNSNTNGLILLNTTGAQITYNFDSQINGSTNPMIAYCFAEIKGFSKFGSYTGNGSSDGTFVYTGFKPSFIMIKSSSSAAGNWLIQDNKRLGYNASNSELYANLASAESTNDRTDLLSNGFKARINSGENNSSGVTYIYMAFAENPFVTSGGIPVTAR